MPTFDLSLYLVTDSSFLRGRNLIDVVAQAIAGGVTMVQLREKEATTRHFYNTALTVKQLTQQAGIPLIINDRVDIALAVDADGLHIGQSDLPYPIARRLMGHDKIIGLSVETLEQAQDANLMDVDYLGISPVFGTATKTDIAPPFGLDGTRQLATLSKHPLVGIGGINLSNARQVMQAGAHGVAIVSAIMCAEDPKQAAADFLREVKAP